jgi:hypothetical protein
MPRAAGGRECQQARLARIMDLVLVAGSTVASTSARRPRRFRPVAANPYFCMFSANLANVQSLTCAFRDLPTIWPIPQTALRSHGRYRCPAVTLSQPCQSPDGSRHPCLELPIRALPSEPAEGPPSRAIRAAQSVPAGLRRRELSRCRRTGRRGRPPGRWQSRRSGHTFRSQS